MSTPRYRYYILKDKKPVVVKDLLEWAKSFEEQDRIVASDMIDGIHVSTVFLGLDHGFDLGQPGYKPQLFETMVFGGPMDYYQQRYATWAGAEYGHKKVVEMVKEMHQTKPAPAAESNMA